MRDRLRKDEAGIGIVEVVIAIAIINVAIMAMFAMFQAGGLSILRGARVSNASVVAEKQMELYRGLLYANISLNDTLVTAAGSDATHTAPGSPLWGTQVTSASCSTASPECQPVQASVTGPDGRAYRVDTYIVVNPVTGGRPGKRVTVRVSLAADTSKVLATLTSDFDLATGCIPNSATAAYKC